MNPSKPVQLSIIVPVGERRADLDELYAGYRNGAAATGHSFEFVFVLDGQRPEVAAGLKRLIDQGEPVTIVHLTRSFGESTALMAGFEQAVGDVIVTLPAYHQIEPSGIAALVNGLNTCDMTTGHRWPRKGGSLERLRRGLFHGLLSRVTGQKLKDLGCGARALKRRVLEEVTLYGDQHRFLPVLAYRQGFKVVEVDVPQSPQDRFEGSYRTREYAHRFLDVFTVFFLVRFTKKPLRFFGMVGVSTFLVGVLLTAWLVIERLFLGEALASRPALLLSSLLVVLGLQVFAIGLLGELIIFTHARDLKDYQVDRVFHFPAHSESKPGDAPRIANG